MRIRPKEAARYAMWFLPAFAVIYLALSMAFGDLPQGRPDWFRFIVTACIFTLVFSLVMTIYRKPK